MMKRSSEYDDQKLGILTWKPQARGVVAMMTVSERSWRSSFGNDCEDAGPRVSCSLSEAAEVSAVQEPRAIRRSPGHERVATSRKTPILRENKFHVFFRSQLGSLELNRRSHLVLGASSSCSDRILSARVSSLHVHAGATVNFIIRSSTFTFASEKLSDIKSSMNEGMNEPSNSLWSFL